MGLLEHQNSTVLLGALGQVPSLRTLTHKLLRKHINNDKKEGTKTMPIMVKRNLRIII